MIPNLQNFVKLLLVFNNADFRIAVVDDVLACFGIICNINPACDCVGEYTPAVGEEPLWIVVTRKKIKIKKYQKSQN